MEHALPMVLQHTLHELMQAVQLSLQQLVHADPMVPRHSLQERDQMAPMVRQRL